METPADPYPSIPRALLRRFLVLAGVFMLYAASSGPVFVSCYRTGFPSEGVFRNIYIPLLLIADTTETQGLIESYLEWWYDSCKPKDGYKYPPITIAEPGP